jgi:hypothetical protein
VRALVAKTAGLHAGTPATAVMLVDVPKLVTAYYTEVPTPVVPAQPVAFSTSGPRGPMMRLRAVVSMCDAAQEGP